MVTGSVTQYVTYLTRKSWNVINISYFNVFFMVTGSCTQYVTYLTRKSWNVMHILVKYVIQM